MLLEPDPAVSPVDLRQNRKATHCGGGVVTCFGEGERWVAMVQRKDGYWVLPKGHVEAGETILAAAHREIGQETGLWTGLELVVDLGPYRFEEHPDEERLPKLNHFFLFERVGARAALSTDAEHRTADWHPLCSPPRMKYPYQQDILSRVAALYLDEPWALR